MSAPAFKILFQDNHLIVVDKPAGLATMGAQPGQPSLVAQVKQYLKVKFHKPGNVYLGVVSRLDSVTSGVLVLARTSKAAARLSEQFKANTVDKQYLAIVAGHVSPSQGSFVDWIKKNDAAKRMVVSAEHDPRAKRAELSYSTGGCYCGKTLLQICLLTGRKHQIRLQFSHRQLPILGDSKYGSKIPFARGIALHAESITIDHPTQKKPLTFVSSPGKIWNLDRFGFGTSKKDRRKDCN